MVYGQSQSQCLITSTARLYFQRAHRELVPEYEQHKKQQEPIMKKRRMELKNASQTGPHLKPNQPKMDAFIRVQKTTAVIKRSRFDKLTIKFIVNGLHPLSTVEEQGFKDLVKGKINI